MIRVERAKGMGVTCLVKGSVKEIAVELMILGTSLNENLSEEEDAVKFFRDAFSKGLEMTSEDLKDEVSSDDDDVIKDAVEFFSDPDNVKEFVDRLKRNRK